MGLAHGVNIVKDGLVFYVDAANPRSYPGSGASWNTLVGDKNLTLYGSPTYQTNNLGGLVFDGSDEYAQTTTFPEIDGLSTFTFNLWIKYGGTDTSAQSLFCIPKQSSWAEDIDFRWYPTDAGGPLLLYTMNTNTKFTNEDVNLSTTAFTNICLVVNSAESSNADKVKVYINGNTITNDTGIGSNITVLTSDTQPLIIGGGRQGNSGSVIREFDGNINIVSIYNRSLTAQEVKQNYNALKGRFGL